MEIMSDNSCLTCQFSLPINEDEYGNPEYVKCCLYKKDMSCDDICTKYK